MTGSIWICRAFALVSCICIGGATSFANETIHEVALGELIDACTAAAVRNDTAPLAALGFAETDGPEETAISGLASIGGKIVSVSYSRQRLFDEPAPYLGNCVIWGAVSPTRGPSEVLLWRFAEPDVQLFVSQAREDPDFIDRSDTSELGYALVTCGERYSQVWYLEPVRRAGVVTTFSQDGTQTEEPYNPSETDDLETKIQILSTPNHRVPTCAEGGGN